MKIRNREQQTPFLDTEAITVDLDRIVGWLQDGETKIAAAGKMGDMIDTILSAIGDAAALAAALFAFLALRKANETIKEATLRPGLRPEGVAPPGQSG